MFFGGQDEVVLGIFALHSQCSVMFRVDVSMSMSSVIVVVLAERRELCRSRCFASIDELLSFLLHGDHVELQTNAIVGHQHRRQMKSELLRSIATLNETRRSIVKRNIIRSKIDSERRTTIDRDSLSLARRVPRKITFALRRIECSSATATSVVKTRVYFSPH